jgi:hypothetical protein
MVGPGLGQLGVGGGWFHDQSIAMLVDLSTTRAGESYE